MEQSVKEYVGNVYNAVSGVKPKEKEPFATSEDTTVSTAPLMGIIVIAILVLLIGFLGSYGAARLSYCYNIYIGNSSGAAFGWSILSFFFSGFYYPIYGLFLNPLCSKTSSTLTVGGRRR
jgi:hypothetical protein